MVVCTACLQSGSDHPYEHPEPVYLEDLKDCQIHSKDFAEIVILKYNMAIWIVGSHRIQEDGQNP